MISSFYNVYFYFIIAHYFILFFIFIICHILYYIILYYIFLFHFMFYQYTTFYFKMFYYVTYEISFVLYFSYTYIILRAYSQLYRLEIVYSVRITVLWYGLYPAVAPRDDDLVVEDSISVTECESPETWRSRIKILGAAVERFNDV